MATTGNTHSSHAFPLRCYSSVDPRKACDPPSPPSMTENAPNKRRQKKPRKSIKIAARDFVTRKVNQNLEDDYEIMEMLGEGGFGEVYRAIHRATGSERAVKVLPRSPSNEEKNEQVRNEFEIVKNLDHPNILKQYNMYESEDNFYLVTDIYLGGEMFDELERNGLLVEEDAAALMNHLLSCITYCHQHGICHRDLKPENILLCDNGKWEDIKLIDFGLATHHNPNDGPMTDVFGSPYYISPQVLEGDYTNKADIWSCGVVAYVALSGYAPFDGDTTEEMMDMIHEGSFDFYDEVWDGISEEAKDFIECLLTYDEGQRPSASEALKHPWLVKGREASKQAAFSDARRRSSIEEALQGMESFEANSKLKQATYALLSSQLMSKEARAEIDEIFRVLDADCSGQLTKDEVQKGFADFYKKKLSEVEVDDLFEKVNFSHSGAISYSEFVCVCLMQTDGLQEKRLRAAFDEFDIDRSGSISENELKQIFGACEGNEVIDEEAINAILAQVDGNGDGEICFDEFQTMMSLKCGKKESLQGLHESKSSFCLDGNEDNITEFANESNPDLLCKHFHSSTNTATTHISSSCHLNFEDDDDHTSTNDGLLDGQRTISP
ncbi:MAP kinase-activated protein kinase 2 (Fragment) [Seminavis robusta]|uniref:non-specific serine/threonine protein kinase n=1 Tax=Seminavis robusta TaxID=568900 RepID=A0A9N8DVF1_9STRA